MQPPGWKEKGFGTAGFMDLRQERAKKEEDKIRKRLLVVTDTEMGEGHRRGRTLATKAAKGRGILHV